MTYEHIARILALQERRFTRWHELAGREQESYRAEARFLVYIGAQYDPTLHALQESLGE